MLPLEWLEEAEPVSTQLLVRRHEEQEQVGRIWIPPGAAKRMRPPFATIVKVGKNVDPRWEFEEGDIVALSPISGIRMMFGNRQESHYLYSVYPQWVICGVRPDQAGERSAKNLGEHPFRVPAVDPRQSQVIEGRRDHGKRKAPAVAE